METATEAALIERARAGDHDAFGELYEPAERPLAAFLHRMVAIRCDAEDLAQDTAVAALENVADLPLIPSFRSWIFRIALAQALEYLGGKKPWDPDGLIRAGQKAGEDQAVRRKLQRFHESGLRTTYAIREHVDLCFTFMGRTLPPQEKAALLLIEVHGFSPGETAATLGVSVDALRFRLDRARQALVERYESRCSLINPQGTCTLCAGLDMLLYQDRRRTEEQLFQIELAPRRTPQERAQTFDQRLAIVRSIDPLHAEGTRFQEFWTNLVVAINKY